MTVAAFEGQDVWLVAKLRLLLAFVLLYYYSQSMYLLPETYRRSVPLRRGFLVVDEQKVVHIRVGGHKCFLSIDRVVHSLFQTSVFCFPRILMILDLLSYNMLATSTFGII